jgi:nucleoside-diphosphate-sugar epimerase
MKLILTGATGFVGKQILDKLTSFDVNVIGRSKPEIDNDFTFFRGNIDAESDYGPALADGDVVIHSAARAHIMDDKSADPLTAFREVNTIGTINLAKQAAQAGVKRFIFISSIKVNGEHTYRGKPFDADDKPSPEDPYGRSKAEAEEQLKKLSKETGMDVVIIRPPLVYGPGVKANFATMMRLAATGIPLPFGGIKENRRSLVSLYNLVDLIVTCISHPNAANQTFLVSDDEDLSTAKMLKELSVALGKSGKMLSFPVKFFEVLGKVSGKSAIIVRLCGSLQVDISKTKELLDWQPPVSVKEGFARTAEHYLNNK